MVNLNSVLIVEDNEDVNSLLAEALIDSGYKVSSSYNGIDGLKEIKDGLYDLVLSYICKYSIYFSNVYN